MSATLETTPSTNHLHKSVTTAASSERLVLRANGPDHVGVILRIAGAKCAIGSAASCAVRLMSPGVQPVHCSIVRGPRGTVVRRWSPDTQLNGRDFLDAPLRPGDRITCGSVELEVLSGVRPGICFPTNTNSGSISLTIPVAPACDSGSTTTNKFSGRSAESIRTARELVRGRVRRLIAQLRSTRWELARRESEAQRRDGADHELVQRVAELETLIAEYRQQLSSSEQKIAAREAEHKKHEGTLREQLDQIQFFENDRQQLRDQLEKLQAAAATDRDNCADLESQVAELKHQHSSAVARQAECELEQQQLEQTLAQTQQTLEQNQTQYQTQLTDAHAQLEAVKLETTNHTELVAERDDLQTQLATAQEMFVDAQQQLEILQQALVTHREHQADTLQRIGELELLRDQLQHQAAVAVEKSAAEPAAPIAENVDVTALATKMQNVEQLLADLRSQNDQLRDQIVDLTSVHDEAVNRLEISETSRVHLEQLVNDLSAQLVNAAQENSNPGPSIATESLATLEAQAHQWQARAEELQSRIEELESNQKQWESDRRRLAFAEQLHLVEPAQEVETATAAEPFESENSPPNHAGQETAEAVFNSPLLASLLRNNDHAAPEEYESEEDPLRSRAAFLKQRRDMDSSEPEVAEVVEEETTSQPFTPVSAADILAKMGHSQFGEEAAEEAVIEEQSESAPGNNWRTNPIPEPAPAAPAPVSQTGASVIPQRGHATDEEESIEDYMSRLMKRVRGDAAAQSYQDQTAKAAQSSSTTVAANNKAATDSTSENPAADEKPKYVPRQLPADFRENFSQMRELANASARTAIEVHQKRNWKENSKVKLIAAASSFTGSLAILYYSQAGMVWQILGACAGFGLTGYWILQARRLSKKSTPQISHPKPANDTASNEPSAEQAG